MYDELIHSLKGAWRHRLSIVAAVGELVGIFSYIGM